MHNGRLLWAFVLVLNCIAFVRAGNGILPPTCAPTPDLAPRADKASSSPSPQSSSVQDSSSNTNQPTITATGDSSSLTGKQSGTNNGNTGTITGTITGTKTGTRTSHIPFNSPPGGIDMKTPSIMDSMQYYPVGGPAVTFVWNMTSILVSPTAVNIEAYCSDNQQYYTIASNYSAQQTSVTWDTGKYQASATAPLLFATYTLYIYDSSKSRTAFPSPGQLSTYNNLRFGLYSPKPATPLSQYTCDLCSVASDFSSHGLQVFLGTAFVFAVTMAWFIAGVVI